MSGGSPAPQAARLDHGGRIDRTRPLRFVWEGRQLQGYAGDTLASALVANGVRLLGRSFKYHRPRGLIGAGVEESNVLVQLGTGARSTPNMQATEIALYDGLVAGPVNCWPSSRFDIASLLNVASRFLPAGFYYKTFMWPHWHLYEGFIRHAAGLGKVARHAERQAARGVRLAELVGAPATRICGRLRRTMTVNCPRSMSRAGRSRFRRREARATTLVAHPTGRCDGHRLRPWPGRSSRSGQMCAPGRARYLEVRQTDALLVSPFSAAVTRSPVHETGRSSN